MEYALGKVEVILLVTFFLSLHLNSSPFIVTRVFYGSVLACLIDFSSNMIFASVFLSWTGNLYTIK